MIIYIFLCIQIILLIIMLIHYWVDIAPFNDIATLHKKHSKKVLITQTIFNGIVVLYPLLITYYYLNQPFPSWAKWALVCCYGFLTLGTVMTWWVPYLVGESAPYSVEFNEYQNTHHFLPVRSNNLVPNTLHVILHMMIWSCFAIALYLFFKR